MNLRMDVGMGGCRRIIMRMQVESRSTGTRHESETEKELHNRTE